MWLIENLFIMEIQRLIDLGKQMHLEGEKLCEFVLAQQAVARDERIRISQEKKESRIAAKAEKERIAAIEDEDRIAAKAEKERITAMEEEEKIRQRKKEDEASSAEKAARIRRHEEEDEEEKERVRRHEEEMCHLRMEADNIRRRKMLQEVWKDAEERRREEEDEGGCSISVTDRELWRKCFREQEALARKEAEEIRQHKAYRLQRVYERLQWEKEDVARKAAKEEREKAIPYIEDSECVVTPINSEIRVNFDVMVNTCEGNVQVGPSANETSEKEEAGRDLPIEEVKGTQHEDVGKNVEKQRQHEDVVNTAELQHVKVVKTEVEDARQHKDVVDAAEMQHVEVTKTVEDEKMQLEKVMKTAAEDALQLEMVIPDSEASYVTEDGGDASEQEASHHPTDDDDADGSMSEERERNDIGQVRGSSLPAPFVWRTSKMPEDRPRLSSWQDHSRKRSSDESDRRMVGSRHLPLSKKSRFSSWARKKAGGTDVDEGDGYSR